MLELDNLAFDYGLTIQTREKIQEKWQVEMTSFQTFLINSLRRWHVASISLAIPILIILTTQYIESSAGRERVISSVFVGIVAVGESIELCILYPRRTPHQNVQRIVCFLLKVAGFVAINLYAKSPVMQAIPNMV